MTNLQTLATSANGYYSDHHHHHHHQSQYPSHPYHFGGYPSSNGHQNSYAPSQHPTGPSFGQVYYPAGPGGDGGGVTSMEIGSQVFDTLHQMKYKAQHGSFDPKSYAQVENYLMPISAQFPALLNEGMTGWSAAPTSAALGASQTALLGHYSLPMLNSSGAKDNILELDQLLEQAQATIYEHSDQMAAAGLGQPGVYHVTEGMDRRPSHSPPTSNIPMSPISTLTAMPQILTTATPSGDSPPALTPTGSINSFASAHSPPSISSNLDDVSPTLPAPMYPTLPGSGSATLVNGYFPPSMPPTSVLGTQFQGEEFRRRGGGRLQQGKPLRGVADAEEEMGGLHLGEAASGKGATSHPGDGSLPSPDDEFMQTPTTLSPSLKRKPSVPDSMIDPALTSTGRATSPSSPFTGPSQMSEEEARAQENWVVVARTIEALRAWIKMMVDKELADRKSDDGKNRAGEGMNGVKSVRDDDLYPVLPTGMEAAS